MLPESEIDEPNRAQLPSGEESSSLAGSASLLALGNILGRVLGLLREIVISFFFGASGLVSAFTVASIVPTMLYDFLVGGMLSAALVPVLSEYATAAQREELIRLVGALLSLLALTLGLLVILLEVAAPSVAVLMAGGFASVDPSLLPLTVQLLRWIGPAVWFTSMAGLLTAVLYAFQRFTFPALAAAVYNLGIIIAAPLLAPRLGITSLAIGVVAGSAAQFALMAWDVRRAGLTFELHWSHPALARIFRLYLPIAAGLVVAQFQIILDRRLASGTGVQSIAWMRAATTLQQMPLGLISVAISLAALPQLSRHHALGDQGAYRATLRAGIRLVILLIVPALLALGLLAEPAVRIVFERGAFSPSDTIQVAQALRIYLIGALFAAIDFPLNYAFYARNNTLWPSLVGLMSVFAYLLVALLLIEDRGYLGLVWADSAKHGVHALIMLISLMKVLGLKGRRVGLLGQIGLAAAGMTAVVWLSDIGLATWGLWSGWTTGRDLLALASGAVASLVYFVLLRLMGVPEATELQKLIMRRLGREGSSFW